MEETINVLNYNVRLFTAEAFQNTLQTYFDMEHFRSILFLSVPILEEVMSSKEYSSKIAKFQLMVPGEEDVLMMHSVEEYRREQLLMDERYMEEILGYLQETGKTLYIVGDQYEKLVMFKCYCEENYKDLQLVGTFVGGEKMDDDSLLNDINVTCPDVILTAIEPQLQENWLIDNVDKLNGRMCIGADVLVRKVLEHYREEHGEVDHGVFYKACVKLVGNVQKKMFRVDYENYMKQYASKE